MDNKTVIDHIVLLKVRPDATEDEIRRMRQGVLSLKAIPGVLTITVGEAFAEEWMPDRRFTHTLSVRLESKDALKVYQDHPMHVTVKDELIVPLLAGPPIAIDYESEVVLGDDASK
ncbi:hypothetical protein ACHAW6_009459 [Cyclotella cf. meneghiniana]